MTSNSIDVIDFNVSTPNRKSGIQSAVQHLYDRANHCEGPERIVWPIQKSNTTLQKFLQEYGFLRMADYVGEEGEAEILFEYVPQRTIWFD